MAKVLRRLSRCRSFTLLVLWVVATLVLCSCDSQVTREKPVSETKLQPALITDIQLKTLFGAIRSPQTADTLDMGQFPPIDSHKPGLALEDQALWPLYTFMLGEVYRLRQEPDQARKCYQSVVKWAASDPYQDNWGGSGLASVALWRWLQLVQGSPQVAPDEAKEIFECAARLRKTRLMEEMFVTSGCLIGLPQLEEQILRSMLALSLRLDKKKEAQEYFLDYLDKASIGQLNEAEQALKDELTAAGKISPGKVPLLLGKRLEMLGDFDGASEQFNRAMEQGETQIKAEVSYHLAQLQRLKGGKDICATPESLAFLQTTIKYGADPDLVQDALFLRAKLYIREGCNTTDQEYARSLQECLKSLEQLKNNFPYGRLAVDAQYQMAMHYLDRYWEEENDKDFDYAVTLLTGIREYKDRGDYLEYSSFRLAMAYYTRGRPEDRQEAASHLRGIEEARPFGPLHLNALFWLGRLAEESGDQPQADRYFNQIIKEMPYSYYAIRASMHLNLQSQACRHFIMDPETQRRLAEAYQASQTAVAAGLAISSTSPYHLRLKRALDSHLYYRALCTFIEIKRGETTLRDQRCETIPLADLDRFQLLAPMAVFISLRQDALAAVDRDPVPEKRLEIAGTIRYLPIPKDEPPEAYGDWPLIIHLTRAPDEPLMQSAIQKNPYYLAIAYPPVFESMIRHYSHEFQVEPEVMYGLMREESDFYPLAMSRDGAMGLLQFSPWLFKRLEDRWKVLREKRKNSRADFLFDPEASIFLGTKFFREELLPRYGGDLALSLLDYMSGRPAVRKWLQKWELLGKEEDYEYMLETARYRETANMVRQVFVHMSVVQAGGLYRDR